MGALTSAERRRLQEVAYPDRFSDGSAWIDIARAAAAQPAVRNYTEDEWQAIAGGPRALIPRTFTAAGSFAVRGAYEAERLKAQLVTLAGEDQVRGVVHEFAAGVRGARSPTELGPPRIALLILSEALQKPARRDTFTQIVKAAGLDVRPVRLR